MSTPPLFIPLKREHFNAFAAGPKQEEYRMHGPRWNERTCAIGRSVVLSMGYGRARRLTGQIIGFRVVTDPSTLPGWTAFLGNNSGPAAAIRIQLCQSNHPTT